MKRILSILVVLCCGHSHAQDLEQHRWKDRVILITANSEANQKLQQQLNALTQKDTALTDRKLVIYTVTPNTYTLQFPNQRSVSNDQYCANVPANTAFKIILVGLDGQIKLTSSTVVSSSTLFDTIDQMPMRKQELTKKSPQDY